MRASGAWLGRIAELTNGLPDEERLAVEDLIAENNLSAAMYMAETLHDDNLERGPGNPDNVTPPWEKEATDTL